MDEQLAIHQVASRNDSTGDEFDRLCESCGYNLRGLTESRCPECGRQFDLIRMPLARIPWLHRKEIGLATAYFRTVWQVLIHPREFAGEFRRPNLIPVVAGEKFRTLNIWIAVVCTVVIPMVASVISVIFRSTASGKLEDLLFLAVLLAGIGTFVYAFLHIALILPASTAFTFGRAGMAVILDYASAPVVLAPLWALSLGALFASRSFQAANAIGTACVLVGCGIVGLVWVTQIMFVSMIERFKWSRIILFAIRLTVHWAFSVIIAIIATCFVVVTLGLTAAAAFTILTRKS